MSTHRTRLGPNPCFHPSPLNKDIDAWTEHLTNDIDRDYLLKGLTEGFRIISRDSELRHAEVTNYKSATGHDVRDKVERARREEIQLGNYIITTAKPKPVPRTEHSKLCPHKAIVNAFKLLGAHDSAKLRDGPAFVYTSGDQVKPLTYTTFTTKLSKLLEQCGFDGTQYSGHSFCRGGATFALHCGVPGHYIKLQGHWLSNAYQRYLDTSLQYKIMAVNMMGKSIPH